MEFTIVGKNMEVTPALDAAVREKLGRLDRFFSSGTTVHVTMSVRRTATGLRSRSP